MSASRFAAAAIVGVVLFVLCSSNAWAQQAAGIAGVVRDATGAVLPGVTVEAASPALIALRSNVSFLHRLFNRGLPCRGPPAFH